MTILQMPVRQLGLMVNSFARASTCGARLFALLDLDIADRGCARMPRTLEVTDGVLRFENVSFAYPQAPNRHGAATMSASRRGAARPSASSGRPAAASRRIAHLIPRFYDVTGGRITIDGQDIRDVTLHSLRQAVAVVQQDAFLFTTTIENNIAYGDPWAKEPRIERASESRRSCTTTCSACRWATAPSSASAASRCPAASASGFRSPAR